MEEKKYLSLKDKLTYGAGNFGSQFVMTFIASFILIFMTDTIGLKSGTIGTLMAISMVLDGVTDVFFGTFIDRTHTKMGKARPWMLWGIFPLVICEVLLFMIPQSAGKTMQYAYFFVVYTLINAIFYTIVAVSYNTLSALITKNSDERVQIGVIGFIFNFAAAMLIPSVTPRLVTAFGGGTAGWRAVAILFAVIAALGMLVTVLTAKELPEEVLNEGREAAPKMKFRDNFKYLIRNKYFIFMLIAMVVFTMNSICFTSTGTYFAKYILKNENMLGVLTLTTMAPMIVALVCAFSKLYIPMLVCFVLRSLFMGPFAGTQNAIIGDICDYSYLKYKVHIDGTLFSCVSMGSKLGNGLSTALVGWLLEFGGYVGTAATQTSGALRAITLIYVGLPVIYAGINAFLLCNMNVAKAKAELKEHAE